MGRGQPLLRGWKLGSGVTHPGTLAIPLLEGSFQVTPCFTWAVVRRAATVEAQRAPWSMAPEWQGTPHARSHTVMLCQCPLPFRAISFCQLMGLELASPCRQLVLVTVTECSWVIAPAGCPRILEVPASTLLHSTA